MKVLIIKSNLSIKVKDKLNECLFCVVALPQKLLATLGDAINKLNKMNLSRRYQKKKVKCLKRSVTPNLVRVHFVQTRGFIHYLIRYHMEFLSIYCMFLKVKTAGK